MDTKRYHTHCDTYTIFAIKCFFDILDANVGYKHYSKKHAQLYAFPHTHTQRMKMDTHAPTTTTHNHRSLSIF